MILLDTHALLWMDRDDPALGPQAREAISRAWRRGEVAVSAISWWECAMLAERARISLPGAAESWRSNLIESGLLEFPIDGRVALTSASLEDLHRDPADRFILATAMIREATLVTADARLLEWPGQVSRLDARR